MKTPRQCVVLVGGLGTRLGQLTADTPKPLLTCGDRPFLAWILRELTRFGFDKCVLLAGYKSKRIEEFCRSVQHWLPKSMNIDISVEPVPAGTGGALWHARHILDDTFLLINGDSWVDFNLARLFTGVSEGSIAHMALRTVEDASRYGRIELNGDRVVGFFEKQNNGPGTINCGMYSLSRQAVDYLSPYCSLETDVLPILASKGLLSGQVVDGYFIDIGVPADYERSQTELPARLRRPAVFFDRDGVLNEDTGWVGTREAFHWVDGAKHAVQAVNDAGYHAFIVTNQAGVARGLYTEEDVHALHQLVCHELREAGATIDDIRYCAFHPEAVVERYRKVTSWRKPDPGMINDLLKTWDVVAELSVLIGDKQSDLDAAMAARIPWKRFEGGRLDDFVRGALKVR